MTEKKGLIALFAHHRVASNLLMAVMMIAGLWAMSRINVQFLPQYQVEIVSIDINWPGASAEDIENSITLPIEKELRDLDNLKRLTSTSRTSNASINVEFEQGSPMSKALEDVRERVSRIRNLPEQSKKPIIFRREPYEPVAKLIIYGPQRLAELRPIVRQFERDLLDAGIAKIDIMGLPNEEIAIQIPTEKLVELNLSLPQIAERIAKRSVDLPAGTIGKTQVARQLRSLKQGRTIQQFMDLPLATDKPEQFIRLGDIAKISRRALTEEVEVRYRGKPAVEMRLLRAGNANALKSAKTFQTWLKKTKPQFGDSLHIRVYEQNWRYIKERINLLMKNGLSGLLLIILILFLFLNRYVAWWVFVGIPTSFLAAIAAIYFYGESINMISLFALIMALGIIVDDTIVVGEQALTNIHHNMPPMDAVQSAAHKMLAPITASSLTTVCAFLPLLMIGDVIGSIIFAIPLVIICVILASLLECFLVLPGHLLHSLREHVITEEPLFRKKINHAFQRFQHHRFRYIIRLAIAYRYTTLAAALALFLISIALVASGIVKFTFFPSPEGQKIICNMQFTVGTPPRKIKAFMIEAEKALYATNKELSKEGESLLETAVTFQNYTSLNRVQSSRGEQYAAIFAELTSPDKRSITNDEFIKAWKKRLKVPPGIENFTIFAPRGGPPGEDIDIQFISDDVNQLKAAAIELKNILHTFSGVSNVNDDLPFGQQQLVFDLNSTGRSLGLNINDIGIQLRAAFNGEIAQIFHEPNEEIEVRVMLPDNERNSLTTLEHYPIITPNGGNVPLNTVAVLSYRQGPEVLLHTDTKLSVHVTAKVNEKINNANNIIRTLQKKVLPDLVKKYNLKLVLRGKSEEQADTFADMKYGLFLGLTLIYIILAWVFSSYGWPIVVMLAIPLGLTGAIFGHLFMRLDLTILSMFGIFGLSGIIINDSIILLSEYKILKHEGMHTKPAIVEASCRRLRAVILTSITTIAGLTPILFETSLQAQFLIPMATTITFGLAYGTVLILIVVPALLAVYEEKRKNLNGVK